MSARGTILRGVLPVIAGAAAGLLVSMWFSASNSSKAAAVNPAPSEVPTRTDPGDSSDRAPRVVLQLLPQSDPRALQAPDATEVPDQAPPEIDEAEARERHQKFHEEAIRNHHNEPRDVAWAKKSEQLLVEDLQQLPGSEDFTVSGVDCRSQSCTVSLQWESYDRAKETYSKLLHHRYRANCGRGILLEDPVDSTLPYEATMIMDCAGWRAREGH